MKTLISTLNLWSKFYGKSKVFPEPQGSSGRFEVQHLAQGGWIQTRDPPITSHKHQPTDHVPALPKCTLHVVTLMGSTKHSVLMEFCDVTFWVASCHLFWFPAQRFPADREQSEVLGLGTRLVVIFANMWLTVCTNEWWDPLITGVIISHVRSAT